MTGVLGYGAAERSAWQRRAVAQLGEILAAHRDLPIIAWTVASAGSVLAGQVSSVASAQRVRATFDSWCDALLIAQRVEQVGPGGTVRLWAKGQIGSVKVTLTASMSGMGGGR